MMIAKRKHTYDILNVLVLFILSLIVRLLPSNNWEWINPMKTLTLLLMLYDVFIIYKKKLWVFDFAVGFTAMNYLFVMGYLFIWKEGVDRYPYWSMDYSSAQWLKGMSYGLCYIHAMFTGLSYNLQIKQTKKVYYYSRKYPDKNVYKIGKYIFLFCIPFKLYTDLLAVVLNRVAGEYSAVVSTNLTNGMIFNFSLLINVGLIYMICSRQMSKRNAVILFVSYYLYAFGITMFAGGRRFTVTAFLATLPCLLFVNNIKLNLKKTVIYGLLAYVGVVFLIMVSETREALVTSFGEFIELGLEHVSESSILFDFVYEFGNTVFTYIIATDAYPTLFPYSLGLSLIAGWIFIFPGAGRLLPSLRHNTSITGRVMDSGQYNYWFGGSLGQELYGNFGHLASVSAVFLGMLFKKCLGTPLRKSSILTARYFAFYYILLNLVRSDMNEFMRLAAWSVFLPYILNRFMSRKVKKKSRV